MKLQKIGKICCLGWLLVGQGCLAEEPSQSHCLAEVDRIASKAEAFPPMHTLRTQAESLLRRALGEAGSAEFEECLELAEAAECILDSDADAKRDCRIPP